MSVVAGSRGAAGVEPAGGDAAAGQGGPGAGGRRWLVTGRDLAWLGWLGRWRFATAAQLARHFEGVGESAPVRVVERRLRGCRDLGLVESARVLHAASSVHWLTRDGLRLVGLNGGSHPPRVAQFRHDLGMVDLAHWWGRDRPGWGLVTEREIRRDETPNPYSDAPPRWSLQPPGAVSTYRRLYPDLVTISPQGKAFGLELELSRKDHARLVRLMSTYALNEAYAGAAYFADATVLPRVQAAAEAANQRSAEAGRGRRITVRPWPPPPPQQDGGPGSVGDHRNRVGQGVGGTR